MPVGLAAIRHRAVVLGWSVKKKVENLAIPSRPGRHRFGRYESALNNGWSAAKNRRAY